MTSEAAKRPRLSCGNLRFNLLDPDVVKWIRSAWVECASTNLTNLKDLDINVIQYPFPVCVVSNFIANVPLLQSVVKELESVKFYPKNNDLYQFMQSDDVRNLHDLKNISQAYDILRTDVHSWLGDIFVKDVLKSQIAATFSSYRHGDTLLCHDDKCEDRHIAFVLYLMDDWSEEDGGALQLFNTDNKNYPFQIVQTITPHFNTMIMFEVKPTSYHQVAEVLSSSKKRLSLNGWFHSEGKKIMSVNCQALELSKTYQNKNDYNLEDYFLFNYLEFKNQLDIKSMFVSDSEIQLEEFIVQSFWEACKDALRTNQIKWTFVGPANIRRYEVAETSSLPQAFQTLKDILESKDWFKYLKTITGLDLTPSATSDLDVWERGEQPFCNVEIQRWTHGCYTLIHDQDPEFHSKALDALLRFPFTDSSAKSNQEDDDIPEAGHVIYVDKDSKDDECLLHIGYKMNSLGLIFRDTKTLRFTKYLNAKAEPFYQVMCTYRPWRPPVDEPELRHCEDETDSEPSEGSHLSDHGGEEEIELDNDDNDDDDDDDDESS